VTLSPVTTIRPAIESDLEAVVAAYNAGISERIATLETRLRTPADIAGWLTDGRPFLVAEHEGRVLGWARAGFYSDRCVYEGVGEHAVYVHPAARGHGLGRAHLIELCAESERHGLYNSPAACPPTTNPVASRTARPGLRRSVSNAVTASSTGNGKTASS